MVYEQILMDKTNKEFQEILCQRFLLGKKVIIFLLEYYVDEHNISEHSNNSFEGFKSFFQKKLNIDIGHFNRLGPLNLFFIAVNDNGLAMLNACKEVYQKDEMENVLAPLYYWDGINIHSSRD